MKKSRLKWIYITLSGLVFFLLFWMVLAVYSADINISSTTYFFLLIVADLCVTGFLTGALQSSADYEGNVYHGKLKLSGAVVVFLVILGAGYKFRPLPKNEPFDLTIYAYGEKGRSQPLKNGIIRVQVGNETKSSAIDTNGRAVINNINPDYLGKKITLMSSVPDYHINAGDTQIVVPQKSLPVIYLPLVPDNDSLLVKGNVFTKNKKIVKNLVLDFADFSKKTITDSDGNFSLYLPLKAGDKTSLLIKNNDRIIFNHDIIIDDFLNIQVDD